MRTRETLEIGIEFPGKVMLTLSSKSPVREAEAPDRQCSEMKETPTACRKP